MALSVYRQDTVFTTWEVSYNAVLKQCPEAAEILLISSFFSNQNIPEYLFEHFVQPSAYSGKPCAFYIQHRDLFICRAFMA